MKKRIFNINQIAKTLGVEPRDIVMTLSEIITSGEKVGFVDKLDMKFYQLTSIEFQNLITKFNNSKCTLSEGKEIVSKLIKDLKVDTDTLKRLLLFFIENQQLKGTFNSKMTEFVSLNFLYQTILRMLFNMGRLNPKELAEEFEVSENIIREAIVDLQSNNKLKGIYINEGKEYIIYETLKNEILDLIDKEFGMTVPLISSQLNVSEEMISKTIDDLLFNELIFIQSTPVGNEIHYITHRKITEEILTALKVSDRKNLNEISTRFNISLEKTKEILYDLVAQGRIIGYIDERNNEFIQQYKLVVSQLEASAPLNTILLVDNVKVKTKSKVIIENITFYLQENKILGIVGPSGTGKSTFLKAIIGQMPLASGKISISGYNTKDMGNISKIMGYVPQDLSTIYPNFSIMKNMEHFGKQYDLTLKEITKRGKKILKELKIKDLADELVKNLSGGEKRRASIAISIVHYPKILFLDEPTSGLDPVLRKEFWKTLIKLNENYNMTLVVVTHYPDELQFVSKAVLFAKEGESGKIIAVGTPKELISSLPGDGRVILIELKQPIKDSLNIFKQITNINTILEERKNEKFRIFTEQSMKEVVNLIVNKLKLSSIRNISQVEANMVDFFRLKVENQ
ncbi:MAG: ATP-binding cassette domain-containing protein [Candidatus Helarchaeota archaeon]|nr:ATP-binding cassette domain-containing protein [Candidatus Helarchaeota archaeon]